MLLHEWAGLRYPQAQVLYQLRLGPTERTLVNVHVTPALEAMLRTANWYADAVVLTPNEGLVVESKVEPDPRAVGQVLFYFRLFYSTPALAQYLNRPFTPVVLFGESDPDVTAFAHSLGCRVEVYTPVWIAQYLERQQFRTRSTPSESSTA